MENEMNEIYTQALNGLITMINIEDFCVIIDLILHCYPDKYTYEYMIKINEYSNRFYGSNIECEKIFREIKNLISDIIYNRISKKYKQELISKGLDSDRLDIIFEKVNEHQTKEDNDILASNSNCLSLENFMIQTKAPINSTNNRFVEESNILNENLDSKKFEVFMNMEFSNGEKELYKINKTNLISMFEEIEKLQEKIDELY